MPGLLFSAFDGMDDRYLGAFHNYPNTVEYVVAAWGTTGEVDGEPLAILVATAGHIITGYVDTNFDVDHALEPIMDEDDEDHGILVHYEPMVHSEPNARRRLAALLARLRRMSPTNWLLVHDADDAESWLAQGFRIVEPPADVPAEEALLVLAWGELPEDVYALMNARGLSWHLDAHRGFKRKES